MAAPNILNNSVLQANTDLAATLMGEIQSLLNTAWTINYAYSGASLKGSANNLQFNYSNAYESSVTVAAGTPALMSPAMPPLTENPCAPYGNCTVVVEPGMPSYTIVPGTPAVMGSYSTNLKITANAQLMSSALTPLFSNVTFSSGTMSAPNSSDQATETVTYNLNQQIPGSAIRISGEACYENLSVTIGGTTTNFGDVSTNTLNLSPVPNIPISFDAIIAIPSFNASPDRTANGVAYELFPQASSVSLDNLDISGGAEALLDFINGDLLSYLTTYWNTKVQPLYTNAGGVAPESPSESLSLNFSLREAGAQSTINQQAETTLNALLAGNLSTIQSSVQPLTAAAWDYGDYPMVSNGNYSGAILSSGLFSGVNASYSTFTDANLSDADFSYANLVGANFSGANLSGTNFTGATGAPTSSALASALQAIGADGRTAMEAATFSNAVIFGANFTGSSLEPSGAFYDASTQFAAGYDPTANGLRYWSAPQFVAGSKKLIKAYGTRVNEATDDFSNDSAPCGCPNKDGIRTDVITGQLALDGFNEKAYFRNLAGPTKSKFVTLFANNPELDRADTLAMYKIAKMSKWTREDRKKYVFSNNDLITRYSGSPRKAVAKARDHYLNQGFFQQRPLSNEAMLGDYANASLSALSDSRALFLDQANLAEYSLFSGYQPNPIAPMSTFG